MPREGGGGWEVYCGCVQVCKGLHVHVSAECVHGVHVCACVCLCVCVCVCVCMCRWVGGCTFEVLILF